MAAAVVANYSDELPPETCFYHTGNVRMVAGSYYVPKTNELKPLREDAHFVFSDAQTIGIADGVGGWARVGIDSGKYARQLMINAVHLIREHGGTVDPRKVLKEAFLNTTEKGASTACILTVEDDCLHAVNVGDSSFLHMRFNKVIYRSPVQQHYFNCPFQLSVSSSGSGSLSSAMEIKRALVPGDIIVAGTDWLFDNVHEEEIEQLVKEGMKDNLDMRRLLGKLEVLLLTRLLMIMLILLLQRRAERLDNAPGGKYDDITVVVAYIIPEILEDFYQNMDTCPVVA